MDRKNIHVLTVSQELPDDQAYTFFELNNVYSEPEKPNQDIAAWINLTGDLIVARLEKKTISPYAETQFSLIKIPKGNEQVQYAEVLSHNSKKLYPLDSESYFNPSKLIKSNEADTLFILGMQQKVGTSVGYLLDKISLSYTFDGTNNSARVKEQTNADSRYLYQNTEKGETVGKNFGKNFVTEFLPNISNFYKGRFYHVGNTVLGTTVDKIGRAHV